MTKEQGTLFDDLPVYLGHVSKHPLYDIWAAMVARCCNPKNRQFSDYGGRGIYVADEWRNSSRAFVAWAINAGWKPGLQLDRENNDGPYSSGNCRFVTRLVNANNKRNNVRLSDGTALCDAIRASGLNKSMVYDRLQRGVSPDDAVSIPPVDPHKRFLSDGTPLADAIRASGLHQATVYTRVQRGVSPDDAVSIPPADPHKRFLSDGTPLADAIRASGLPQGTVYSRLRRGVSPDDAVSIPPVDPHKRFLSDGTPLADAIRASGLPQGTVYSRLRLGWSPDDAVSIPKGGKRPAASAPSIKGKGRK